MSDLYPNPSTIRCPNCKAELVRGKFRRYEMLVEHVTDPNQYLHKEPPLRATWVCPNRCYGKSYWDINGDAYTVIGWIRRFLWKFTDYSWPSFPISPPDINIV